MFVNHAVLQLIGQPPPGVSGRKHKMMYRIIDVSPEFFDPKAGFKVGHHVLVENRNLKTFKFKKFHSERNVSKTLAHVSALEPVLIS
jgi:hypothetical protein